MANVKIVRLNTGEELLCTLREEFIGDRPESYVLSDITLIVLVPPMENEKGQKEGPRMALAPYLGYADLGKGLSIEPKSIMFIVNPKKELVEEYNRIFNKSTLLTPSGMGGNKLVSASGTQIKIPSIVG